MPRAENRKRPANSLGNTFGNRNAKKTDGNLHKNEQSSAMTKKQELIERMKKIQESKKVD